MKGYTVVNTHTKLAIVSYRVKIASKLSSQSLHFKTRNQAQAFLHHTNCQLRGKRIWLRVTCKHTVKPFCLLRWRNIHTNYYIQYIINKYYNQRSSRVCEEAWLYRIMLDCPRMTDQWPYGQNGPCTWTTIVMGSHCYHFFYHHTRLLL